jgi:hypothetical protein
MVKLSAVSDLRGRANLTTLHTRGFRAKTNKSTTLAVVMVCSLACLNTQGHSSCKTAKPVCVHIMQYRNNVYDAELVVLLQI